MRTIPDTFEELYLTCGSRLLPKKQLTAIIKPITDKNMLDDYYIINDKHDAAIRGLLDNIRPLSDKLKQRLESTWWYNKPILDTKQMHINTLLCDFIGEAVKPRKTEPYIDELTAYGQFWFGNSIKHARHTEAHYYTAIQNAYNDNTDNYRICVGYAINQLGIWQPHAWIIHIKDKSSQIIEYSDTKLLYYGIVLPTNECNTFVNNYSFNGK